MLILCSCGEDYCLLIPQIPVLWLRRGVPRGLGGNAGHAPSLQPPRMQRHVQKLQERFPPRVTSLPWWLQFSSLAGFVTPCKYSGPQLHPTQSQWPPGAQHRSPCAVVLVPEGSQVSGWCGWCSQGEFVSFISSWPPEKDLKDFPVLATWSFPNESEITSQHSSVRSSIHPS